MRIRKRTPARAASPPLSASPPPKERAVEAAAAEEEEKRVILVGAGDGDRGDDRVPAASRSRLPASALRCRSFPTDDDGAPKPEPEDAAGGRCSRNDGKRWRCKNAAVPGLLFCDRHVAWSTRKRKPRPPKIGVGKHSKSRGVARVLVLESATSEDDDEEATPQPERDAAAGFYCYGGFQPGTTKRAVDGAPPA